MLTPWLRRQRLVASGPLTINLKRLDMPVHIDLRPGVIFYFLPAAMQITTDRLLLRDFLATDWAETLAYQRDPRYLRFYPWTDRAEAEVKDFIQGFID